MAVGTANLLLETMPPFKQPPNVADTTRLVEKDGHVNVTYIGHPGPWWSFLDRLELNEVFNDLLEMRLSLVLILFAACNITSWTLFASMYWAQAYMHNDFADHGMYQWIPCINNTEGIWDMLLFSFGTQTSIGVGERNLTTECPLVVVITMFQLLCGLLSFGILVGFVLQKIARSKERSSTMIFSKNAVVAKRDGLLCLMIRIADRKKTFYAEARIRMQLIRKKFSAEGQLISMQQSQMDVGHSSGTDRFAGVGPMTVVHEINKTSPLYEMSKASLFNPSHVFEIVVTLEGIAEGTETLTQVRTSYLPKEVQWGQKFARMATYQRSDGTYVVNLSRFNGLGNADHTPLCSAKDLEAMTANGIYKQTRVTADEEQTLMNQMTINDAKDVLFHNTIFGKEQIEMLSLSSNSDIEFGYSNVFAEDEMLERPKTKPKMPRTPSQSERLRREFDMF